MLAETTTGSVASTKLDFWVTALPAKYEDHTGEDGRHEHNSGAHGLVNPRPEQPGKDKHSSDPASPPLGRFNKCHFTHLHRKPCQGRRIIPYSLKREIAPNRVRETEKYVDRNQVDGPPWNQRGRAHPEPIRPFRNRPDSVVQLTRTHALGSLEVIQ
jgi:hypothetical protein